MSEVRVFKNTITIPTYKTGEPCPHPLFLEKRVYQGSSGKVYPNPVTESVTDEKIDKQYTAIYLENEYLSVMILPEVGGKIQRVFDKTNGTDAVYYNEVIKPALTGLTGPWALGGIEFNWPQHHRPSAYNTVNHTILKNDDGSITVWCSEVEKMSHTKGMAGITLYPGKAYIEVKGRLYNPTEIPQTFSWWANPSVEANENTKTILPPDVHAVLDHNKRAVSKFPEATGIFCGTDFSEGVDISRYKNIPEPLSYMAQKSEYDFIGSYDFGKEAGILHIADHHISPGKKQWTWGTGDYGSRWVRNLTDNNKPYVELMAGVFTDNQPDFTFLMPYEEKSFKQYFIPYKKVGDVKSATLDVIANLEVKGRRARVILYAPEDIHVSVMLTGNAVASYMKETAELTPYSSYEKVIELDAEETEPTLIVKKLSGETIIQFTPPSRDERGSMPEPLKAARPPKEIASTEELYLAAVHLEQYRHAIRRPEEYYLEGLRRDPGDIRLNNGYGKVLYKKGLFDEAEKHFRAAIERATSINPNPYDCEPYYNLGLALKMQQRYDEAYDAFYKSIWDGKMQDKGFYQLACVSAKRNDYKRALEFVDQSLARGVRNMRARVLKSALLRRSGRTDEALEFTKQSVQSDPLDFGSRYELFLLTREFGILNDLTTIMRGSLHNYIDLSISYAEANLYTDASNVLALVAEENKSMLHYYMAYYSSSNMELAVAEKSSHNCEFPNRLQSIMVLSYAIENNPGDWFPHYALGNLYYDKGVWFKAIKCWKDALEIAPHNSFVLRNLAISTYNKLGDGDEALKLMERAVMYAPEDARLYYELDLLRRLMNVPIKKRIKDMTNKIELVESRDDLFTEYITLLNEEQFYEHALRAIKRHSFHHWDGGEGRIARQYKYANIGLAYERIAEGDHEGAAEYLNAALEYPENLGEGKPVWMLDADVYYRLGMAYENVDKIEALRFYKLAVSEGEKLGEREYYGTWEATQFFFMTLAYGKLGNRKKERGGFNRLIDCSEAHIDDNTQLGYFSNLRQDFVVFDGNMANVNYVNCCYMAALGWYGRGDHSKTKEFIKKGMAVDSSHQGLQFIKNIDRRAPKLKREDPTLMHAAKWSTSK
ncbi:MAG: DUF5107 domain-containing protein [Clostridia bacterium]|nr:DUF5107 domain-containing protein [Clostridia bacterium]